MLQQPVVGFLVDADLHAEGLGDRIGGDVVMGRPDAPGGDHVIEPGAAVVDRGDDGVLDVRYDPCLAQAHAELVQADGEKRQIGVLGAAGQDFIADHDQAGGDFCGGHGGSVP